MESTNRGKRNGGRRTTRRCKSPTPLAEKMVKEESEEFEIHGEVERKVDLLLEEQCKSEGISLVIVQEVPETGLTEKLSREMSLPELPGGGVKAESESCQIRRYGSNASLPPTLKEEAETVAVETSSLSDGLEPEPGNGDDPFLPRTNKGRRSRGQWREWNVRGQNEAQAHSAELRLSQTTERECVDQCCPAKRRKNAGAASYGSKFNSNWTKQWPFICAGTTLFHFWCAICQRELECRHQGRTDVIRHMSRKSHLKKQKLVESSSKMHAFTTQSTETVRLEKQKVLKENKSPVHTLQMDMVKKRKVAEVAEPATTGYPAAAEFLTTILDKMDAGEARQHSETEGLKATVETLQRTVEAQSDTIRALQHTIEQLSQAVQRAVGPL